ncbi:hypothetical protein OE88DRAFT_369148 [Heliocybe sulcata]|uniref:Uncharacterized protein n=1 Tax=Heliocybe sulcata TaxID=5364 RepID=A0A5C3MXW7_9AGAM|nr:hypothetical protein OE88DRAFT_369148 [Heliocybe sulcata]
MDRDGMDSRMQRLRLRSCTALVLGYHPTLHRQRRGRDLRIGACNGVVSNTGAGTSASVPNVQSDDQGGQGGEPHYLARPSLDTRRPLMIIPSMHSSRS